MSQQLRTKKHRSNYQSNTSTTILFSIVIFYLGIGIVNEINPVEYDLKSSLISLLFLIVLNIGLFLYMGLHKALRHSPHIRKWKLKQKGILGLYFIYTISMIINRFQRRDILTALLFLGFLYIVIRLVMRNYKIKNCFNHCNININKIDKMSGREFELFLSKLYNGLGYYTEVTPTSGDFGIDVITQKNEIKSGIQAKRYQEGSTIGVSAVQEVCAGAAYWKVQKKVVITNVYFTKQAKTLAKANNVELIDRDGLKRLINEAMQISNHRRNFNFFPFLFRWKHR
ncbi:MAG: restriction endonuclease [Solibacillus sp.]